MRWQYLDDKGCGTGVKRQGHFGGSLWVLTLGADLSHQSHKSLTLKITGRFYFSYLNLVDCFLAATITCRCPFQNHKWTAIMIWNNMQLVFGILIWWKLLQSCIPQTGHKRTSKPSMILIKDKFFFLCVHTYVTKLNSIYLYVTGFRLMCKQGKYWNSLHLIWLWSIQIDYT